MNKYQEALNSIKSVLGKIAFLFGYKEEKTPLEKSKELDLLQELVDKATPKKPNMENIDYICCPNCCSDEIELYDYYGNEVS